MSKELIRLRDCVMAYDDGVVLDHINLYINDQEFLTLLGPSGCGKTTTLRIIGGFLSPTSGDVLFDGVRINDVPPHKRAVNTVFQKYALFPHLNVFENVAFAMQVIEAPHRKIRRQVNNVLDLVGLRHRSNAYPNELSGGEQQRIAIARAIVNDPVFVIADEPTGNLDPETSWDIMEIFKEINSAGTTIVMATHDKDVVDAMGKRVIAIEQGRIVRDEKEGAYGYEI